MTAEKIFARSLVRVWRVCKKTVVLVIQLNLREYTASNACGAPATALPKKSTADGQLEHTVQFQPCLLCSSGLRAV